MTLVGLWLGLALLVLCIQIYSFMTNDKDRRVLSKEISVYGYLIVAVLTSLLDQSIYTIKWHIDILDLDWGWSVGSKNLFYITLIFTITSLAEVKKLGQLILPVLSSLVILSTNDYQTVFLFSVLSYAVFFKNAIKSKLMFFPTVLLIFINYEKNWNSTYLLQLSDFTRDGLIGTLLMGAIAALYLFHIVSILRRADSVNPTELVYISISMYTVQQTLPSYFSNQLLMSSICFLSLLWPIVSLGSLLSRSQTSLQNMILRLYIFQLSLCSLLPISLEFGHYIVIGLGLLPLLANWTKAHSNNSPASQYFVVFTSFLTALAPISWLSIWPIFELTQANNFSYYVIFPLYISSSLYAIIHISKLKSAVNFEALKEFEASYIIWLLKIMLLSLFLIVPIPLLLEGSNSEVVNILLTSPYYWFFFLLWFSYLLYRLVAKQNKKVIDILYEMTNSTDGKIFEAILRMCYTLTRNLRSALLGTSLFFRNILRTGFTLLLDSLSILGHSIVYKAKQLSASYEVVSIAFFGLFFVYYLWRFGP